MEVKVMVMFILANNNVHYCLVKNNNFEICSVPDVESSYIPAPRDLIVSLQQRKNAIFSLLQNLHNIAKSLYNNANNCVFSALENAQKCMQSVGGKIILFLHNNCTLGKGAFKPVQGDVKQQFKPQIEYTELATKCALNYIQVNVFVFNHSIDLNSLSEICRLSSGRIYSIKDYQTNLNSHLSALLTQEVALEACVRMRCSTGIEIKYFFGKGHFGSQNLINLSQCQPEDTFGAEIAIRDGFKMGQNVYFQLSFLYTDLHNNRYIKVITKKVKIGSTVEFFNSVISNNLILLISKKLSLSIKQETYISSENVTYLTGDVNKSKVKGSLSSNNGFTAFLDGFMGSIAQTFKSYAFLNNFASLNQFNTDYNIIMYYCFLLQKCILLKPQNCVLIYNRICFASQLEWFDFEELKFNIQHIIFDYSLKSIALNADFIEKQGIYVASNYDEILVFFGEGLQMSQIEPFVLDFDQEKKMQIGVENEYQTHIQSIVNNIQQYRSLPVYGICGAGRFKNEFLRCLVESRIDGMGYVDYQRVLAVNIGKD